MQARLWKIADLERELGMSYRALRRRLEGLRPDESAVDQGGRMHARWKLARVIEHFAKQSRAAGLSLDDERAKLAKAQAERYSMDNDERRGQLLIASMIDEDLQRTLQIFRELVAPASTRIAELLEPARKAANRKIVDTELERILSELEESFRTVGRGDRTPQT